MMADVIAAYTDRVTDEVHMPGERVELTEARARELEEGGYVRPAKPRASRHKAGDAE